jgi:CheY-like chemotaxis protein
MNPFPLHPFDNQAIDNSKRGKRILYIEDNQEAAEMMPLILAPAGYEVTTADSHQVSMEIVTGGGFDLILLESWLVEGSGIDLCKAIRAFDARIPIIFFTTAAFEKDIEKAMAAGADAYLRKPDDVSNLIPIISDLHNHKTMTP